MNDKQTPRIAAVQMTATDKLDQNLAIAEKLIHEAADLQADVVVLPEMFTMMGNAVQKQQIKEKMGEGRIQDFLRDQARRHHLWLVGGTTPIACEKDDKVRAACLIYDPEGLCRGRYDKIHLFDALLAANSEIYRESDATEAGTECAVIETPLGTLGLSVCYDVRFPELYRTLVDKGAEILLVPAAFTVPTGRAHWEVLLRARAIENQCYVVAADQVGEHGGGRVTYGHSLIINPWGEVIAQLTHEPGVIVAPIDLKALHQLRCDMPVLRHRELNL
jgi:predicted amidohydrolase